MSVATSNESPSAASPNGALTSKGAAALTVAPFPWQSTLLSILGVLGPILAKWIMNTIENNTGAVNPADQSQNPPT